MFAGESRTKLLLFVWCYGNILKINDSNVEPQTYSSASIVNFSIEHGKIEFRAVSPTTM